MYVSTVLLLAKCYCQYVEIITTMTEQMDDAFLQLFKNEAKMSLLQALPSCSVNIIWS